ncbi:hypothetical protein EIP86_003714 [Pleurotus ostreatoroseus]|nr:hypothetical protein EIP86_003714 [Pleurotus ostreatoroseus]
MVFLDPPQSAPSWTHSPDDVIRIAKEAIEQHRKVADEVASIKDADCTFDNLRLELAKTELNITTDPLIFYQDVSPSEELRDASTSADSLRREYRVEVSMRHDLFRAEEAAANNIKESGKDLGSEEARLVARMLLDGIRAGLALSETEFEELKEMRKELSNTCLEFDKNFNEENLVQGKISFTRKELAGVPEDELSGFVKRIEGKTEIYDIPFKGPGISTIIAFMENYDARKRAHEANSSRMAVNVPIFDKMLELRHKVAALLGYDSWADYVTEIRMAKNAKNVVDFLSDLEQKMQPLTLRERETLLALKEGEHRTQGTPFDGKYYGWDYSYYHKKYIKKNLDLDGQLLKEYFPVDFVVPAVLQMYQKLLAVKFVENPGTTWHPDVKQYAVWENDAQDAAGFLGHCYLDIYPRDGKNGYPYMAPIQTGYIKADGTRSYPVVAMVACFAKATPEKPALLSHFDVKMFFHEMGHVFHELLSQTRFARFHGTSGPVDYAEAPSQMLENWCWEPKVLQKLSCHYKTKEPLSSDLIAKLLKSRYVNIGLFQSLQLFFATYDLKVHMMKEPTDYTKLWNELRESIVLEKYDKLVPGQAAFRHMVGDYSAGYYSYAWSNVFAMDMYDTVFKADPLDPHQWQRYRQCILLPGSSRDELALLEEFLGRPPNSKAFINDLLSSSASEL